MPLVTVNFLIYIYKKSSNSRTGPVASAPANPARHMSSSSPSLRERHHTHAIAQQGRLLPCPKPSMWELGAVAPNSVAATAPNRAARGELGMGEDTDTASSMGKALPPPMPRPLPPFGAGVCPPRARALPHRPEVSPSRARPAGGGPFCHGRSGRRMASVANGIERSRWDDSAQPFCWDKLALTFMEYFRNIPCVGCPSSS